MFTPEAAVTLIVVLGITLGVAIGALIVAVMALRRTGFFSTR
jgi:hypothetical protein